MNTSQLKLNYSIGNFSDIKSLDDKTKEDLLFKILAEMSKDKNSSTFREGVTLGVLGKEQSVTKLGYDSDKEPIEVKPKNLSSNSDKKFDGSGNFSDFTWARHQKYKNDNVKMIVSGFLDGKLTFVLSFNYNESDFTKEIERQLTKHLPNGDEKTRYVRSVKFSYRHFFKSESFKIEYLCPEIVNYERKFTKPFYSVIIKNESN
jgi:hypothetical protein